MTKWQPQPKTEYIKALESLAITKNKPVKKIFKEPNTEDLWCGKDTLENSVPQIGKPAKDLFTAHMLQYEQEPKDVRYKWNSLGLRGPEPNYNADKKMLVAGGSLSLGTGVHVEESFPHVLADMLEADYINISDADAITDLIDPLKQFKDYNPDYVLLSDTRFVQSYSWALVDIYRQKQTENMPAYRSIFLESDIHALKLFDYYLKGLFPNAKLILAYTERRAWKSIVPEFSNIIPVPLSKTLIADLSRDNCHPGPKTHYNFAKEIYTSIM